MTATADRPSPLEDEFAFEQLVRQFGGRMLAAARRILNNEDDAREAVQNAFLSAYRSRDSFQGQSQPSIWLHRIAINAALQLLRRRKQRDELNIDDLLPRFAADGHQAAPARNCNETAEAALQRRETRTAVRAAIDRLPEAYRTVLMLRDIEELNSDEAARLLGATAGVVKVRLHRARLALRQMLDERFQMGTIRLAAT